MIKKSRWYILGIILVTTVDFHCSQSLTYNRANLTSVLGVFWIHRLRFIHLELIIWRCDFKGNNDVLSRDGHL